jgi:hypothetical protein
MGEMGSMNRRLVLTTIVITGLLAAITAFAQRRDRSVAGNDIDAITCGRSNAPAHSEFSYDQVMKEIDAISASLKKNLDGTGAQGIDEVVLNERGGFIRLAQGRLRKPPTPEQIQACSVAAVDDATKLQSLLKEIQQFWASFETDDAVDLAKSAQDAAGTVVAKLKGKDFDAAQEAFGSIRENCRDCHFSHRETTAKGFIIKP